MPKLGNEYYQVDIKWGWKPTKDFFTKEICKHCNGKGKPWKDAISLGISFDEDDRNKDCNICGGLGYIRNYFSPPKPKYPKAFIDYMEKAYKEYLALPDDFENSEEYF